MLLSIVPKLSRVAILMNPTNLLSVTMIKRLQVAAQQVAAKIVPVNARSPQEIGNAFSLMIHQNVQAIIVPRDGLFVQQQRQIAELAAKHRLPSVGADREFAEAGGLIGYGPNAAGIFHHAATFVDKILKGAKPADLPVEQPTKFELVINGKTAKALGLTIPQSLLISADKVIE
jgi:putative ABC transport system substrate-binding protein